MTRSKKSREQKPIQDTLTSPPSEEKQGTDHECKLTDEEEIEPDSLLYETPKRPRYSTSGDDTRIENKAKKLDSDSEDQISPNETLSSNTHMRLGA